MLHEASYSVYTPAPPRLAIANQIWLRECRDNFMLAKNLREAAALHRQLRRVVEGLPPESDPALPLARLAAAFARSQAASPHSGAALPDPPVAVMNRLQRAVAAGWADQVCSLQCISPTASAVCAAKHALTFKRPLRTCTLRMNMSSRAA